jgi:hypothetical protein
MEAQEVPMSNKYDLVASFETDEEHAREIEGEVSRLLDRLAKERSISLPCVAMYSTPAGTCQATQTPSAPAVPLKLSCNSIFHIERDII